MPPQLSFLGFCLKCSICFLRSVSWFLVILLLVWIYSGPVNIASIARVRLSGISECNCWDHLWLTRRGAGVDTNLEMEETGPQLNKHKRTTKNYERACWQVAVLVLITPKPGKLWIFQLTQKHSVLRPLRDGMKKVTTWGQEKVTAMGIDFLK